jgi:hypothetical protein
MLKFNKAIGIWLLGKNNFEKCRVFAGCFWIPVNTLATQAVVFETEAVQA